MITLYGGRMVLERRNLMENWHATIKLPLHDKRQVDLKTPDVRQAYIRAQYHYIALRDRVSLEEVEAEQSRHPRCWECIHFLHRGNGCVFEFPEARQTMGRFAAKCQMFSNGTTDIRANDTWDGALD